MRKRRPNGDPKRTCSKCGGNLQPKRIGKQRYCNGCHNANMREERKKHAERKTNEENALKLIEQ